MILTQRERLLLIFGSLGPVQTSTLDAYRQIKAEDRDPELEEIARELEDANASLLCAYARLQARLEKPA